MAEGAISKFIVQFSLYSGSSIQKKQNQVNTAYPIS